MKGKYMSMSRVAGALLPPGDYTGETVRVEDESSRGECEYRGNI